MEPAGALRGPFLMDLNMPDQLWNLVEEQDRLPRIWLRILVA